MVDKLWFLLLLIAAYTEIIAPIWRDLWFCNNSISKGEEFDVFLLDILMPEMTGIKLAEHLQKIITDPLLVFLTSSENFYSDAFRLYAFQYLCKPIAREALFCTLDKVAEHRFKRENDVFLLKTVEGLVRIPLREIVYIELLAHICHFYLSDGQHLESLYLRTGIDSFAMPLLSHSRFIKTHTSYIVNMDFVMKLSPGSLSLMNGKDVPVARSYGKEVLQRYVAHGLGTRSIVAFANEKNATASFKIENRKFVLQMVIDFVE